MATATPSAMEMAKPTTVSTRVIQVWNRMLLSSAPTISTKAGQIADG